MICIMLKCATDLQPRDYNDMLKKKKEKEKEEETKNKKRETIGFNGIRIPRQ